MQPLPSEVFKHIFSFLVDKPLLAHDSPSPVPDAPSTPAAHSPQVGTPTVFSTPGPTTPAPSRPSSHSHSEFPIACRHLQHAMAFAFSCKLVYSQFSLYLSSSFLHRRQGSLLIFGDWDAPIPSLSAKSSSTYPNPSPNPSQQPHTSSFFFQQTPLRTAAFACLSPATVHVLGTCLKNMKSLTRLEIQPLEQIGGKPLGTHGINILVTALSTQQSQYTLDLQNFLSTYKSTFSEEYISPLITNSLASLISSYLHTLDIPGQQIGPDGASLLASFLSKNTILTSLNLSGNALSLHGTELIIDAIIQSHTSSPVDELETISVPMDNELWNVCLGVGLNQSVLSVNSTGVVINLPTRRRLTTLDVSNNAIGVGSDSDAVRVLQKCISVQAGLQRLNLSANGISSPVKIRGVLNAVKQRQLCKSGLKVLDLGYNSITGEVLKDVFETFVVCDEGVGVFDGVSLKGNDLGSFGAEVLCGVVKRLSESVVSECLRIVRRVFDLVDDGRHGSMRQNAVIGLEKRMEELGVDDGKRVGVECLDLSFNKIGRDGCKFIQEMMNVVSHTVEEVERMKKDVRSVTRYKGDKDLVEKGKFQRIVEKGVLELEKVKGRMKGLKKLDFRVNLIGLHGARALEECLEGFEGEVYLNI
ncbi:hypothetical protein HK098_003827 [Nowakowskiella sp. JEL0407]|nr:hypothetical protein HK098_003827 [Nowakowskiella sp. JEL0407]